MNCCSQFSKIQPFSPNDLNVVGENYTFSQIHVPIQFHLVVIYKMYDI